jgi:hypothetical protein
LEAELRTIYSLAQEFSEERAKEYKNSFDRESRTLLICASAKVPDSYRTVFSPRFWDSAKKDYERNPIILKNHNQREKAIAMGIEYTPHNGGLDQLIKFATTVEAGEYMELYAGGYMRSWSTGARVSWRSSDSTVSRTSPKKILDTLDKDERSYLEKDLVDFVFLRGIHLETSAVALGASPGALTRAVGDSLLTEDRAEELYSEGLRALGLAAINRDKKMLEKLVEQEQNAGSNESSLVRLIKNSLKKLRQI